MLFDVSILDTSAQLINQFTVIRSQTDRLVLPLSSEDCSVQSMNDASPSKWHLGHTSCFFEMFLLKGFVANYCPVDPGYELIFNDNYHGLGHQYLKHSRSMLTRPDFETVVAYRAEVNKRIIALLIKMQTYSADIKQEITRRLVLGIHHEQKHQELLLTDIKHAFSCNPIFPAYQTNVMTIADKSEVSSALYFSYFEGGEIYIGSKAPTKNLKNDFYFENETPAHPYLLLPFSLANRLTTNGEYLEFIDDGGYLRPELWLADGWSHLESNQWYSPLYWVKKGYDWYEFTLHGLQILNDDEPVCHLSYYEADAFARWKKCRLPSEYELEYALEFQALKKGNYVESGLLHPQNHKKDNESKNGLTLSQLHGNCWEWTRSSHTPYPGFKESDGAVIEINGKFMCNQMVLKGGSCLSAEEHIRPSYRHFLYPHQRWQMTGLRLAKYS